MKKGTFIFLILTFSLISFSIFGCEYNSIYIFEPEEETVAPEVILNSKYIISVNDDESLVIVQEILKKYYNEPVYVLENIPSIIVDQLSKDARDELNALSFSVYIEANETVFSIPVIDSLFEETSVDSEYYPINILRVGADKAHAVGADGNGTIILIIDSGFEPLHQDLKDRSQGGHYDILEGDEIPNPSHIHGSHVAGIALGSINGVGIIGVAPESRLISIKCFNSSGGATVAAVVWALDVAASKKDIDVISMSWGASKNFYAIQLLIGKLYDQRVILVAASGNGSNRGIIYPAKYAEVIAVGSVIFQNDNPDQEKRADYSSYGPELELMAPGTGVVSSTRFRDEYGMLTGTSMSVPNVAGVFAVVKQYARDNGLPTSQEYLRDLVRRNADDIGVLGWDEETGYGVVNVFNVVLEINSLVGN